METILIFFYDFLSFLMFSLIFTNMLIREITYLIIRNKGYILARIVTKSGTLGH